jgi:ribonuclease-3
LQPTLGNEAIEYRVTDISGPDHEREFKVEVWIQDQAMGSGIGGSKKVAEEEAAREALEALEPESGS